MRHDEAEGLNEVSSNHFKFGCLGIIIGATLTLLGIFSGDIHVRLCLLGLAIVVQIIIHFVGAKMNKIRGQRMTALEAKFANRNLTPKQRASLIHSMAELVKNKGVTILPGVVIWYVSGDAESMEYATEIESAIKEAGWVTYGPANQIWVPHRGIFIYGEGITGIEYTEKVKFAFSASDIAFVSDVQKPINTNIYGGTFVKICVGAKD